MRVKITNTALKKIPIPKRGENAKYVRDTHLGGFYAYLSCRGIPMGSRFTGAFRFSFVVSGEPWEQVLAGSASSPNLRSFFVLVSLRRR